MHELDNLESLELTMRIIAEDSLQMSESDARGIRTVKDRYCKEDEVCFAFDCNGKREGGCDRFRKLPTGVKICVRL